ncbi:MAG: M23 family metallopeptidase [Bacteroidota bacterium]
MNSIMEINTMRYNTERSWICLLLISMAAWCNAQPFPQHYFISPMDTPLYLSAPFGSLRENHFHSGMDIRTYEKEGLPVYAVADGYISRIKVSAVGYGKAVYIDHPNGYTSVYAHLQNYNGELAIYIKAYQYENETAEFDHFPGRDRLKVSKGQIIGWSGNSGASTGPHLHFEIRETKSEEPLNPQLFNIPVVDLLPPALKRIAVYDLNANENVLIFNQSITSKNTIATDSGFVFTDTVPVSKGLVGIGMEAVDYLVTNTKEYSIYCTDLYFDRAKRFSFRLNRINFNDTKNINAYIDYEIYKKDGYRIQKCFLADGNRIQLYPYLRNKGKLIINDTLTHQVKLCIGDFSGKVYTFYVHTRAGNSIIKRENLCNSFIFYPEKDNSIKEYNLQVSIPAKALYDTTLICYAVSPGKNNKALFSDVFHIHNPYTPLQKNIAVSIRSDSIKKSSLLLAFINKDGSLRSAGGEYKNGWVSSRVAQFGSYAVVADSVPPEIKILNINRNDECKDTSKLLIRISDNFSGIDEYRVTVNGKWTLAEFDAKNDLLTYEFDDKTLFNQKLQLVVTITDNKKNTATLQKQITLINERK